MEATVKHTSYEIVSIFTFLHILIFWTVNCVQSLSFLLLLNASSWQQKEEALRWWKKLCRIESLQYLLSSLYYNQHFFFNIIPLNAVFSFAFTKCREVKIFAVLLRRYSLSCVHVTLQRSEVLADYYRGEGQIEIL